MRLTVPLCRNYFKRYIDRALYEGRVRSQWHPLTGFKEIKKRKFVYTEHRPWEDQFHQENPLGKRPKRVLVQPLKDWHIFKGDRVECTSAASDCIPWPSSQPGPGRYSDPDRASPFTRGLSLLSGTRNRGNPLGQRCNSRVPGALLSRSFHSTTVDKMAAEDIAEGVLLGIGNPLLDITVRADTHFLEKYGLKANDAIIAGPRQMPMFQDMMANLHPDYLAGGATQNSIRVAQWMLGRPLATTFLGCVGSDERGRILEEKAREAGVNVHYQLCESLPTGVCGAVITGENRSLVAHLGAADYFRHDWLELPETWSLVEKARFYYIGGFVFPVCNQAIFDVAQHAAEHDKVLAMNLSAPFLCKYFAAKKPDITPYIDILFGNETEAAEFCRERGIETDDIREMALRTAALPQAKSGGRSRMVVFTQGVDPTVVAVDGRVSEHPIIPVRKADIRDTNGCGDAFVGGFLSQQVRGAPLEDCLRAGQYAASVVVKHWGCNFPAHPDFK